MNRSQFDDDAVLVLAPGAFPAAPRCAGQRQHLARGRRQRHGTCPLAPHAHARQRHPWPALPARFAALATRAAAQAGYAHFTPDACLVNRYEPGTALSLHQDKNERDFSAPIVSVSLGLPAVFLFCGTARSDRPARIPLHHGDVVVWGGPARLRFHGVMALGDGMHEETGRQRINLTMRQAG